MDTNELYALPDLRDEFPDTAARRAVVAVVRGFGTVQRQMGPYFAEHGLTPPQFQMLTVINRLKDEPITQRRLARELYVSFANITVTLARLEEAELIPGAQRFVDPAAVVALSRPHLR